MRIVRHIVPIIYVKKFYFLGSVCDIYLKQILSMNKFELKTKMGETVIYTYANTLFDAQEKLARIKVLPIKELLEIFIIEQVK